MDGVFGNSWQHWSLLLTLCWCAYTLMVLLVLFLSSLVEKCSWMMAAFWWLPPAMMSWKRWASFCCSLLCVLCRNFSFHFSCVCVSMLSTALLLDAECRMLLSLVYSPPPPPPLSLSLSLSWFQTKSQEELDAWNLVRVSERFRVIALGLPVPHYRGNPLDPPLRSRFQGRDIRQLAFDVSQQFEDFGFVGPTSCHVSHASMHFLFTERFVL